MRFFYITKKSYICYIIITQNSLMNFNKIIMKTRKFKVLNKFACRVRLIKEHNTIVGATKTDINLEQDTVIKLTQYSDNTYIQMTVDSGTKIEPGTQIYFEDDLNFLLRHNMVEEIDKEFELTYRWNKIESVNDLPTERGWYHVFNQETQKQEEFFYFDAEYRRKEFMKYSHFIPKIKLENPK